jgi:hypothetical protein
MSNKSNGETPINSRFNPLVLAAGGKIVAELTLGKGQWLLPGGHQRWHFYRGSEEWGELNGIAVLSDYPSKRGGVRLQ